MKTNDLKNGKVSKELQYSDVIYIKNSCKVLSKLLTSTSGIEVKVTSQVNLKENSASLYSTINGVKSLMGHVHKYLFKQFILLSDFKYYTNRNIETITKPEFKIIPAKTILHPHNNGKTFYIDLNDEDIYIPRWILVKSSNIQQVFSLYLVNEQNGIGYEDNLVKFDLMDFCNDNSNKTSIKLCSELNVRGSRSI